MSPPGWPNMLSNIVKSNRWIFLLLLALLFLLYTVPITLQGSDDFRMVNAFNADEGTALTLLQRMLNDSSLYPRGEEKYRQGTFSYGGNYFYFNYYLIRVVEAIRGNPVTEQLMIIALRSTNVLCALFSAIVLFLLADRLYRFPAAALAAILFLTTPSLLVRSTMAHPEMLQLFFSTLSFYFTVSFLENYSERRLALSALFAALAFGTKYSGLFLLPIIFLALCFVTTERVGRARLVQLAIRFAAVVVLFVLIFAITNPYHIREYEKFYDALVYVENSFDVASESGLFTTKLLLWLQRLTSVSLLGWFCGALFLLYPAIAWYESRRSPRSTNKFLPVHLMLIWIFYYFIFLVLKVEVRQYRYFFPVLPFVYLFCGAAAYRLYQLIASADFKAAWRLRAILVLALAASLGVWTFWPRSVVSWQLFQERLSKVENSPAIRAGLYLKANFHPTTRITYDFYCYVPSSFRSAKLSYGQSVNLLIFYNPELILTNERIAGRYRDPAQREFAAEPLEFDAHHLFYRSLEKNELSGYRLYKEFGEIKIYRKVDP